MKYLALTLRVALFLLLPALSALAQAPANDLFANATPLVGPIVTAAGSNVGATKQFGGGGGGEPSIGGGLPLFGGASVWWNWTAVASGETIIDTEGSSFDTLLGVFTGAAQNSLTLVAGNNDSEANTWSRVVFNAVAGTTYRIMVDGLRSGPGFGSPAMGSIVLHVKGIGGINFTSPSQGQVFTVGDPIPVNVVIDADFPNPPATRVDFYVGTTLFASQSTAPFSAIASNVPPGTNAISVIAFDADGAPVQSPVINVFVQSIGVTLLTPFDGTSFANTNPITVTAWSYLPSGTMTNVEFFVDGVKFGEDSVPPLSAVWSNPTGGSHRLTAVGRSDTGARYTSQPANIGVAHSYVVRGSVWRYLDNGSDQGTAWFAPGFDDSSWKSGPAQLGYGDGDEATVVEDNGTPGYVANDSDRYITTYFRHAFVVNNVDGLANVQVSLLRDDAGVVYVNGQEVFRSPNLPGFPTNINYLTVTSDGNGIEDTVDTFILNPSNLVIGNNVIAVEIHQQAANSSDISFDFALVGVPVIIFNASPLVELTSPTNGFYALAPGSVELTATSSDGDGTVAKVEFFFGSEKIGEDTTEPYRVQWDNPPIGAHKLTAVATDDQGGTGTSEEIAVVIYDAVGTPVAAVTSPADGVVMDGPTNLVVTATADAIGGVARVDFLANGIVFGSDATAPYSAVWTAPFGSNYLVAVAYDTNGIPGASPEILVVITIPPTNVIAPVLATQSPLAGATVTNLTSVSVTFSENVQNIDAGDLLINGVPALTVNFNHSRSNYTFTFAEPPYGTVTFSWAGGHGITDYGFPTVLAFDQNGAGAGWTYTLIDRRVPTIFARTPAAGTVVTNATQITVTFSEVVAGVDAPDLRLNNQPALSVSGSGSNYIFTVTQPPVGTNTVSWSTTNGITDVSVSSNAFVGTGGGWTFILDTRVPLVQSNSVWRFVKGLAEASTPMNAWRQVGFDDSTWTPAPAPFFFGDPYTNALNPGTLLSDMLSNYTTIYLRQEFNVENRGAITNLLINHQSDDGFIAWLNGFEVLRFNVPSGELPYNTNTTAAANEPNQNGAAYIAAALTNAAVSRLVNGVNLLTIHAFNQSLTASTDFGFNAQLYFYPIDPSTVPPRVIAAEPAPGELFYLTNVTMNFSESVSGVNAGDLLVNGVPATGMNSTTNATYTFTFPQPAYGPVLISWVTNTGIVDFDTVPKAFVSTAAVAQVNYILLNPSSPRIATQMPLAGTTVTGLTSIAMTFTEPVTGIEAADLLINGVPATTVASADGITQTFTFAQPAFGAVTVRWATNHGITDVEAVPAPFDPTRFGGQWNYTLINPVPSVALSSPTNNTYFLPPANLTLRATASDNDGTVALVEFYLDGVKLGEDDTIPYTLPAPSLELGRYTFQAIATDNGGLRGTSAPVVVNVVSILPIARTRGPYLQMGSPTTGILRWRTDLVSDGVVYYGTDLAGLTNVATQESITNEHIVSIGGLEPNTTYYYSFGSTAQRLAGGEIDGTNYWFKTSPPVGTSQPMRFWVLGDPGTAGNGSPDRQNATRDAFYGYAATNGAADLVVMLGDNAYNSGTDTEHQAAVFDMYPTVLRNKFLWPTIGNHETSQSTTATDFPYLHIFSLPQNGEAGGVASGTEKYYSFDYGNVHFICLDSMTSGRTGTSAMAQWLENDLNETAQPWVIVFFHHPPYTKGSHDSDAESDLVEIRQNIVPILEANGVDLVLNGHSHCWERSYLLDGHYGLSGTITDSMKLDGGDGRADGDGAYRKNEEGRGVVYNLAGSAGQATGGSLNHPAYFSSLNELGSLILEVSGNRLDGKFIATNGAILDYYTLLKPDQNPPAPYHLTALATNASSIMLEWTPGLARHTGYVLERSTDGVNFLAQLFLDEAATNALDTGLSTNVTYYYRLQATNDLGVSDYSNVASATTINATSVPRAPVALAATAHNGSEFYRSQILLRWQDRSTNESVFQIERSDDGLTFTPVATVAANLNFYWDRSLDSATDYAYRVRARNGRGASEPSNIAGDSTHPQSTVALQGTSAAFHAGSEGAPGALYQWRFLGQALPGQTNESLVLPDVQPGDEGDYTVLVVDADGRQVSNPAYLFVVGPPRIVTEPLDRTNLFNTAASFSVVVNGTAPYTYQWRKNGVPIPGANIATLVFPSAQLSDQDRYDVVVENEFGAVVSRTARLTVVAPPFVEAVPDIVTDVMTRVSFTTGVTDPNTPPLKLTYALAPGAPTNATVNPTNGMFRWTPPRTAAGSTNPITIRVVDATRAALSNAVTFNIIVRDYIEMMAGTNVLRTGTAGSVAIDFYTSTRLTELQSTLQFDTTRFSGLTVEALDPAQASVTLQTLDPQTIALTFTATTGQSLIGTQRLARLRYTAVAGQISAFVPLHFTTLSETRLTPGQPATPLAVDGRIAVIGFQPLIEAVRSSTGARSLTLYGTPGTTNAIQQTTNLFNASAWTLRGNVTMGTNLVRTSALSSSASIRFIYYRLRQLP